MLWMFFVGMGALCFMITLIIPFKKKYIDKKMAAVGEITGICGVKTIDEVRDMLGNVYEDPIVKYTFDGKEIETRAIFKSGDRQYYIGDMVHLVISKDNPYDVEVNEMQEIDFKTTFITSGIGLMILVAGVYMAVSNYNNNKASAASAEVKSAIEALPDGSDMSIVDSDASVYYLTKSSLREYNGVVFYLPFDYERLTDEDTEKSTWFESFKTYDCIYVEVTDMVIDENTVVLPDALKEEYEEYLDNNFVLQGVEPEQIHYNGNILNYYKLTANLTNGKTAYGYGCYGINKNKAVMLIYLYQDENDDVFLDMISSLKF